MDNNTFNITTADLIGQLEGFPLEVVIAMLNYQVAQGNRADVGVFQKTPYAPRGGGGFSWDRSVEGHAFWCRVIPEKEFHHFFRRYPSDKTMYIVAGKDHAYVKTRLRQMFGEASHHLSLRFKEGDIYYLSPKDIKVRFA